MLTPIEWLGVIAVFGGIVLAIAGITKAKIGKVKVSPGGGLIVGAVLIIAGIWGCGLSAYFVTDATEPGATVSGCCTFSVTPAVSASNGVLSADETTVQIPFRSNTTSHVVTEGDNTTWVDPVITFTIKPKCPADFTSLNLANLNYEVTNEGQTVNSDTGTYYMVTKTSNVWQAIWTGDGTEYVDGYTSMTPNENVTLTLTLDMDQTGLSYTQNTFDAQTLHIRLYNECWSYNFDAEFLLIETWTG
jgi:hypothetical protein